MAPRDKRDDKERPRSKSKKGRRFDKSKRRFGSGSKSKDSRRSSESKGSPYRGRRSPRDGEKRGDSSVDGQRGDRARSGSKRRQGGYRGHSGDKRPGRQGGYGDKRGRGPRKESRPGRVYRKESNSEPSRKYEKKLVATCALGLELTVGRELEALGLGPVTRDNAQVSFPYSPHAVAKANYWLRTADRVWLQLGEFDCRDFEELFQGIKGVDWQEMLPQDAWFPVEVISTKSRLESVSSCQAVAKKAACEKMNQKYGMSTFPETGPRFAIRVFIVYDRARVFLDTSGEGLHRRGYRTFNAKAPLRETVAAALVLLSHWTPGRELYDPMCGSGTILLEAASIGLKKAAGVERSFASQRWKFLGREGWEDVHTEALDLFDRRRQLKIFGSDTDSHVLKLARTHLEQAGLDGRGVFFQKRDVAEFSSKKKYGVVITNPPYGRRLSSEDEVEDTTKTLAEVFEPLAETWSLYYYTGFPRFAEVYGRKPERVRKIYNGRIEANLLQYPGPKPPGSDADEVKEPVRVRIPLQES